jgi:pimeloyl-ACP methyl ester carboxylesterase
VGGVPSELSDVALSPLERLLRGSLGHLILKPWFDATTLRVLTRWYFPLSRAWAAALAAEGDVARFAEQIAVGRRARALLPALVRRVRDRWAAYQEADARWEDAFFGAGPALAAVEAERLDKAAALMGSRTLFVPMHLDRAVSPVAWTIEDASSVARRHGRRRDHPETAFAERMRLDDIQASRGYRHARGIDGWLRFPPPVAAAGNTAWARVSAPEQPGAKRRSPPMPSLVFAHGIGMEPEWWGDARDPFTGLAGRGLRVIRPEAPWHGRRRLAGTYGGEPILARGPGGLLDFFHASAVEIGHLVAWARTTRGGPVAVGGISLGALTAQLVACAARHWPPEMRPDALLLVAPSRSLTAVSFHGSLSRGLGVPEALADAGWSEETTASWLPLLDPIGEPAVDPDRIVVVLGTFDDVTLAEGGEELIRDWRVPAANVFRAPAGHFTTSLGLSRDAAPLLRMIAILEQTPAE